MSNQQGRRAFLKTSLLATASTTIGLDAIEHFPLLAQEARAQPAPAPVAPAPAVPAPGANRMPQTFHKDVPTGQLGHLNVTRLFLGSNQVSGYAHGRDLRYLSRLMTSYQTDEKVLETWALCAEHGINTVLSDPFEKPVRLMKRYRQEKGGKLQWISEVHPPKGYHQITLADMRENLKAVLDNGPDALYVQGGVADAMVQQGRVADLGKTLEAMQASGLPSGIGSHSLETPKALVKAGIEPDFFMKTYHADNYWSATPPDKRKEFTVDSGGPDDHDNMWCINPDETKAVMGQIRKPWVAFKVLAAGALPPEPAFRFAFESGADFICVGMFDFHIAENINTLKKVLAGDLNRTRTWCA